MKTQSFCEATITQDLERLLGMCEILSRASTLAVAIEGVLRTALAAFQAVGGFVALLCPDGEALEMTGSAGFSPEAPAGPSRLPLLLSGSFLEATRRREPSWIEEQEGPMGPWLAALGNKAWVCAPLLVDEKAVGILSLGFDRPRSFCERECRLLMILAHQFALALCRLRLCEATREAQLNLTARLAAEAAQKSSDERRMRAELASQLKDDYLARVSHELRTPLAAMRMWIQVLRAGRPEDQAVAIDAVDHSAKVQSKLIEDILDLARGWNGKLRLTMENLDPRVPIEEAVATIRPQAEAKGILLLTAYTSDAGMVHGDAGRLTQVVTNLLSNAVKFTPSGGRIEVLLWRDGPTTVITVHDTGIGIEEEGLAHLFTPFSQHGSVRSLSEGGLGLGLAIARQIVELHGGTIRAESRGNDQGTSFHVALPWAGEDQAPPSSPRIRKGRVGSSQRLSGLTVLLVDDDAPTRGGVARALSCYGAEVIAVASVPEAFSVLENTHPNVILSDLSMPGIDGFAFARELRARGGTVAAIPAAAFTAMARPEDAAQAIEAGFKLHIAKPIESIDLARAVETLTGRREGIQRKQRR